MWGEVLVAFSDLSYPSLGRFRALGAEEQGELSDRERCGIILSQVLAAESPLCHLGATQVGGVCLQRGREGWQAGEAFWDPLRIWWSFQVVGRRSGLGVPGTPGERVAWKEAEASGEGQVVPTHTVGLPPAHTSAPRYCCGSRAGSSWSSAGPCRPCTEASASASPTSASASCHGCRLMCAGSRPGVQGALRL